MPTYQLLVSEHTAYYVQVEAESDYEAYRKYYDGEITTEPYGETSIEVNVVDAEEME